MAAEKIYLEVLLPLRLRGLLTYCAAGSAVEADSASLREGSWVRVTVKGRKSIGIVETVSAVPPENLREDIIKPIDAVLPTAPVSKDEIKFWHSIAEYYMCTPGEVFKAAYNLQLQKRVADEPKKRKAKDSSLQGPDYEQIAKLSPAQLNAADLIRQSVACGRTVLLRGVTGSGKTEIYMHLAAEQLQRGRSTLYLVPEIALSKQLEERLRKVFGDKLQVFHSGETIPHRQKVMQTVAGGEAQVVLGTRSSVFLPFGNLGLVIVDEEHDHSYKQTEPAPRYNGRDAAVMLASIKRAGVLLGSATPSFEAIYNVRAGKYDEVHLTEKYHGSKDTKVSIIDVTQARRHREMKGSFSQELINEMRRTLDKGEQILVFRSRRAYSPLVQCSECGDIPKCPRCNVSLSYHRFNNTLKCHYCGLQQPFTTRCKACGEPSLVERGAGTERVEEELRELFPGVEVSRFDAETTSSKKQERQLIKDFAEGRTRIMVGTQMITKGFDFEGLSLVVLLSADSLFAVQDFRSDERCIQLITQLLGRAGRRGGSGRLIIQTAQKDHPVLQSASNLQNLMDERREFGYPPFVRLITITVKDRYEGRLWNVCRLLNGEFRSLVLNFDGPVPPAVDFIDKQHINQFFIKLPRNGRLAATKSAIRQGIEKVEKEFKTCSTIIVDVDPQ